MSRPSRLILLCMSFLLFTGCGGTGVWYPELNRCGVTPTSDLSICDDGNRINGDGCDENCIRERLAVQTWYETTDCTGKILKTVIRNIREYLVPEGICETGARCTCPFGFETGCDDGSVNIYQGCSCTVPLCEMYAKTCTGWTSPNSTRAWSYRTDCTNTWPVVTPVSPDSPTRVYIILKEWDLTTSRGVISPLGDSSSWELTRRRALGIGEPDQWHIYANDYCIPSFSDLDSGVSRDSVLWEHHDYRNGWTRRECDEDCTNCAIETQSSATLCRDALNCLYLAPGKCMSCIGGAANMTLVGFLAHPGPPSPDMNHCVPCSFSALNNYYGDSICDTGEGCGACETGMACGSCGEADAPEVACGDQRLGGAPYRWITT